MFSQALKELYKRGKYQKILDQIAQIEKQGALSSTTEDEQILCRYYQNRALINLGKYEKALKLAKKAQMYLVAPNNKNLLLALPIAQLHALIKLGRIDEALELSTEGNRIIENLAPNEYQKGTYWRTLFDNVKGFMYFYKDELDTALEYFQRSLKVFEMTENKQDLASSINGIGSVYWRKGDLNTALEYFQRSLKLSEMTENKQDLASSINNLGLIYWQKGELDTALEHFKRSLELRQAIRNKKEIAQSLGNLGLIYWQKGELDTALKYCQRSLELFKVVGNNKDIARSLGNISNIYFDKGALETALEYDQKCLERFERDGSKQETAMTLNNIGLIYLHKGELTTALEYYQRSLDLNEAIGHNPNIATDLSNIGLIHLHKGALDTALEYLQKSLKIRETIGNDIKTTESLFQLVRLFLSQENLDQAQKYLEQLQGIQRRQSNKRIRLRSQLAEALVLKQNKKMKELVQAQEIIEQILRDDIVSYELIMFARTILCQLLLDKFILTGSQSVLDDLQNHLNVILDLAKQNNFHGIILSILFLKGKIELLKLNRDNARSFFQKVKAEAHSKDFEYLEQQCEEELLQLQDHDIIDRVMEMQKSEQKQLKSQQTESIIKYLRIIALQLQVSSTS